MNERELEFFGKVEEPNVSILLKEEAPKSLTIYYREGGQQATKEAPRVPTPRLVVKVPVPFCYASDKAVPWNYTSQAVVQEPQATAEQKPETSVNDIVGTGGMTLVVYVMPRSIQKRKREKNLSKRAELK